MLRSVFYALLLLIGVQTAQAQGDLGDWRGLLAADQLAEAEAMCGPQLANRDRANRVEAHVCLANLRMIQAGQEKLELLDNDLGDALMKPYFEPAKVDEAVDFIDRAIGFAPDDLTLHTLRMDVLTTTGRYDLMPGALARSLRQYPDDARETWLSYSAVLFKEGQLRLAAAYLAELLPKYPQDADLFANLSAVYAILEDDEQAVQYGRQAASIAPDNANIVWNLARVLTYAEENAEAEVAYTQAFALAPERAEAQGWHCLYADFLDANIGDKTRACALRQQYCADDFEAVCR